MSDTALTAARERSPRYPSLTLSKALDRAAELNNEHGRHAVRVESAVEAWRYAPKSSGGRQTLATLLMYGILQDSGSGDDRKVQLTDLAWRYLTDERPEQRDAIVKQLAVTPKIMQELWGRWGHSPPGDSECRSQLKIEHHFTADAAAELLSIYKDNVAFAKLTKPATILEVKPELDAKQEDQKDDPPPPPPPAHNNKVIVMAGERELTTGLLSKDANFRLIVSGKVGVKEIERLIAKLNLDKEILAEADDNEDLIG